MNKMRKLPPTFKNPRFNVTLVIFMIDNDYVVLFISCTKVY